MINSFDSIYIQGSIQRELGLQKEINENRSGAIKGQVETKANLEYFDKYIEAGTSAEAKALTELTYKKSTSDSELEMKFRGGVSTYAESKAVGGKSIITKENEIISKTGFYIALRKGAQIFGEISHTTSSNEGSITGSIGLSAGGVGIAAGFQSEAIINLKSWDLKFSTFAEVDIGLPISISANIQGETNISQEISQVRNDLNQYVQQKEKEKISQILQSNPQQAKQIDRKAIRNEILQNVSGWQQKLNTIKQLTQQKISRILSSFNNEVIKKAMNSTNSRLIKNVLRSFGAATKIASSLASRIITLLAPRINTSINEIKPTDLIKT